MQLGSVAHLIPCGASFDPRKTGNWKELADKLLVLPLSDGLMWHSMAPYGLPRDVPYNQVTSYVFLPGLGQPGTVPPTRYFASFPALHHSFCHFSFSFEDEHGSSTSGSISEELDEDRQCDLDSMGPWQQEGPLICQPT